VQESDRSGYRTNARLGYSVLLRSLPVYIQEPTANCRSSATRKLHLNQVSNDGRRVKMNGLEDLDVVGDGSFFCSGHHLGYRSTSCQNTGLGRNSSNGHGRL